MGVKNQLYPWINIKKSLPEVNSGKLDKEVFLLILVCDRVSNKGKNVIPRITRN